MDSDDAQDAQQDELASTGPSESHAEASTREPSIDAIYQTSNEELSSQEPVLPAPRHNNKKTPDNVALRFVALIEAGISTREAASECGLNISTAYQVLARSDADLETLRAATSKLMAVETLDRIDDWRTAARVGAQKKGNHAPAKDWLLHAGVIDNLASEQNTNIRIAIQIGTDDKPMRIASPLSRKTDDD